MRDHEQFIQQVRTWAGARPDVGAAIVVGSNARAATPADQWSDVDIALFVDHPDLYLHDAAWLAPFGTPLLTFIEPTPVAGALERRVLFEDGLEVDFSFFTVAAIPQVLSDRGAAETLRRGFRVLVDQVGLADLIEPDESATPPLGMPADLTGLANDFWYHALWAAKKLRRGELWVARSCVDCYLHGLLLQIAAIHARAVNQETDTWHEGRFLERWAAEPVVDALWRSLSRDRDAIAEAIRRSVDLFDQLADQTTSHLGIAIDVRRDEARTMLETLLAQG